MKVPRRPEHVQETLALLKILALGQTQIAEGKVNPLDDAVREIKAKRGSAPADAETKHSPANPGLRATPRVSRERD